MPPAFCHCIAASSEKKASDTHQQTAAGSQGPPDNVLGVHWQGPWEHTRGMHRQTCVFLARAGQGHLEHTAPGEAENTQRQCMCRLCCGFTVLCRRA